MDIAEADDNPSLSIKLQNYIGNQNQLSISVKGEYDIQNSPITLHEEKTYTVKVENNMLSLYENGLFLSKFASLLATPKEYGTNNYIFINNQPYLGSMNFIIEKNMYVRPVNTLPMEDYLKGVVPFEMFPSWNKEALKAQAVAARTYATRYKVLDMDDTINFQVYGGYSWYPNSTAAVEETKFQTLTYNGKLIDAFYSASNGGMTESNANVWGGTPLVIYPIKEDPYDTKVPWGFTLKKTQINVSSLDLANPDIWWNSAKEADTTLTTNIKTWLSQNGYQNYDIKIVSLPALSFSPEKTTGGRVKYGTISLQFFLKEKTTGIYVMDSNNQIKTTTLSFNNTNASRIRAMIGLNNIKSYLVTKYSDDDVSYSVAGLGNGHGVGMSQWGAKSMADKGLTYKDILSFYYSGATLTNADSETATIPVPAPAPSPITNEPVVAPAVTLLPPIISNVTTAYSQKSNQISVDYTINDAVTATVYIKNTKGSILAYPTKNVTISAGRQHVVFNVSKIPNDTYTFGITTTNQNKMTASAVKNVIVNKIMIVPRISPVTNKTTVITGSAEPNVQLTATAGSKKIGSGKADSKGNFKVTIPKQGARTKLAIIAKDMAGNTKTLTTTVLDKIAPAKPRVNVVTYKDSVVTGTTEANATVTIKAGTKVIRIGKADSKGKFRLSIQRQRTGTTLYVYSKDGAGNMSAATILKVKTRR
jgi:stage II sporulation protein D